MTTPCRSDAPLLPLCSLCDEPIAEGEGAPLDVWLPVREGESPREFSTITVHRRCRAVLDRVARR